MTYLTLDPKSVMNEHICCAISDKKCSEGYGLKKRWLIDQYHRGFRFQRLNERAKVFIEYGPAEESWIPVSAPDYLMLGCFWVSGKYKGQGHGKALLHLAKEAAQAQNKKGLVAVVGTKKFHFMSDGKFLLKQGFYEADRSPDGFSLLALELVTNDSPPRFPAQVKSGGCDEKDGLVVYFSNRCPFTEYYITDTLPQTAKNRGLSLTIHKLESRNQAQNAPTPATIFSLYYNGRFITTDLGVCLDNRFERIMKKAGVTLI